jgi:5'-deoxynucleotidase YfbR-like HD superfamily hydrolase
MKKFNFKKFIQDEKKLDRVIRFSAHTRIQDESVAEHSFHVVLYAMILADLEEKIFKNKVDKEKVLKTALLHDLEECRTGDIIYDFKHTNEKLAREIKQISRQFFEDLMQNLPEKISKEYIFLWQTAKDKRKIEGKIVEAADKLEGLIYALNEFSLGNKGFQTAIKTYKRQLKDIHLKSVDLILKQIL